MSDVTTDTMMHSVAAGIAVDIAEEGFDRVSAILSGIPGGANRAVGSALARAAAAGKTVAKRAVTQEYAISSSEFGRVQRQAPRWCRSICKVSLSYPPNARIAR